MTPNKSSIETHSGLFIDLADPKPEHIKVEDIAWALSNTCRYNGHCKEFYSVAEHAIKCSYLVPKEYAFAALHHDSSEAYLSDLPSPLKALIGTEYNRLTERMDLAVCVSLVGKEKAKKLFPTFIDSPVKSADQAMLAYEADVLLKSEGVGWTDWSKWEECWAKYGQHNDKYMVFDTWNWQPNDAYKTFLKRHEELINV